MLRYDVEKAQQDEKLLGAQSLEEFLTGNNQFYGREEFLRNR